MSEALVQEETLPLVICDYKNPDHPTGKFGCFRCIDDVLLQRLLLMVDENKVKVFSAPVIPIDMQQTEKKIKEYLAIYIGDEATKPDSKEFFKVLHENNICFKIFFTSPAFITEYENIKILKTIPSVEAVVGEQAVVDEQAVVGLEEQPNFLQQFTTYYEYEYETTDGIQRSCAFMLDFTDSVKIVQKSNQIVTSRIYIILNKFCNNNLTREQKLSKKFNDEILDALKILNSHGYQHADPHLGNVVDCGEFSIPQYKLIDFGNMRKTCKDESSVSDISKFQNTKRPLEDELYWENFYKQKGAAKAKAAEEAAAKAAAKAAEEAAAKAAEEAAKKRAADEIAAKKVELQRKFEIIQKSYPELRKKYRFMITNYISEYLHSVCPKAVVSSSYKSPEEGLNYHDPNGYPSATFEFESKQDFNECTKKLPKLKLLERSLIATYTPYEIQNLYRNAANYDTEFRQKIQYIDYCIVNVGSFLSRYTEKETRFGDGYEDSLNTHFTTLRDIFKFEDQGGGQTKYKLKRRTRRKTRTKSKFKSNSKRGTRIKSKSKSKYKYKTKNKRRTIRK